MNVPDVSAVLASSPTLGGTDEIDAARRAVASVRDGAQLFTNSARSAGEHLAQSRSEVTRRLELVLQDQVVPGGSALYLSSDDGVRALDVYSSEISEIHASADRVRQRTQEHLEDIAGASQMIAEVCELAGIPFVYAWNAPPELRMPETASDPFDAQTGGVLGFESIVLSKRDLYEWKWRSAAIEWGHALGDVTQMRAQWESLINDRRSAERVLQRALSSTAIGELITVARSRGLPQGEMIAAQLIRDSGRGAWDDAGPRTEHAGLQVLIGAREGSGVWESPPAPDSVAARWAALSESQRSVLLEEVPWVIGNLPGVPFADRDRANRTMLEYYITHQSRISADSKMALAEVTRLVYTADAEPPVSIVALHLNDGVPLVSIGYGALDEAEYLGWAVPGMFNDAHKSLGSWDEAMRNQYSEQEVAISRGGSADVVQGALIAFLSYDTPDAVTVLGAETARVGGARLAAEFDGAVATRSANTSFVRHGATGHSYGSTTLAEAASRASHQLDYVTFVGSAGIDSDSATTLTDLNVASDLDGNPQVFTTLAQSDLLARVGVGLSGRQQPNVVDSTFGVAVGTGHDFLSGRHVIDGAYFFSSEAQGDLLGVEGHGITNSNKTGYFDRRTQSISALALIAVGRPHEISGGLVKVGSGD